MREAHRAGLRTTATMMYGTVETDEERLDHLFRLRELQDETGGFTAFITWSYQPEHTELGGAEATGVDYLRTLAIARLVLDNFDNLQASWVTQGGKVGQLSLAYGANDMGSVMIEENVVRAAGAEYLRTLAVARIVLDNFDNLQASWVTQGGKVGQLSLGFGANDMGSVMIEENVVRAAGASYCMDEVEIVRNIENAGFAAKRRNMHYAVLGDPIFRERSVPRRLALDVAKRDGDVLMPAELSAYEARSRAGRLARQQTRQES
jgi:2-iminoacetate synthase ThiH